MKKTSEHFNLIANKYDEYKLRANYYYNRLIKVVKETVPNNLYSLEIGCGTGEMLNAITNNGIGIDVSEEMIKIAQRKYSHLQFEVMSAEDLKFNEKFDVILMIGVTEHLTDLRKSVESLEKISKRGTKILITTVHPLYRPIMTFAGKIGLKMDEGEHHWISVNEIKYQLENNGFKILNVFNDLALPVKIPFISEKINNSILNKWLGLTQYVLATKQ